MIRRYDLNGRSLHWEPDVAPDLDDLTQVREDHPARWMIWEAGPLSETLTEVEYLFVVLAGAIGVLVAAIGTDDDSAFSVARTRIAAYVIIGLAAVAGLVINVSSIVQILSADLVGL